MGRSLPGAIRVKRTNEWALAMLKAQIKAANGLIDGMVIWGDVAYRKDLFFHPEYWRKWYKPGLAAMVEACRKACLSSITAVAMCSRISKVAGGSGIDAYNPLEAKAGMDVVELRRQYGHRIAFCGNMNVMDEGGVRRGTSSRSSCASSTQPRVAA